MLYSSGTTGRPKGIKAALPSNPVDTPTPVYALCALLFGLTDDSVYLSPAPLYHSAPLRFTMAVHQAGGTVVVMEHFDAAEALALIERHQVTFSQWVPTMFIRMLKLPGRRARPLRPVEPPGRGPRRRAVPGRGEAADDRVVGTGAARVLRRHRGQRLRLHQLRGLAGAPRHRRAQPDRRDPHRRRRRRGAAGRRGRHHLVRRQRGVRVPQRPRQDGRVARCHGAGARWATSDVSTTTASST